MVLAFKQGIAILVIIRHDGVYILIGILMKSLNLERDLLNWETDKKNSIRNLVYSPPFPFINEPKQKNRANR